MEMEKVELSLATMEDLEEGKAALIFQAEMKRALLDCVNRPTEKKIRKVNFVVTIQPEADDTGALSQVQIGFDAKAVLPPRKTLTYPLKVTNAGQAYFVKEADEDVTDPIDD